MPGVALLVALIRETWLTLRLAVAETLLRSMRLGPADPDSNPDSASLFPPLLTAPHNPSCHNSKIKIRQTWEDLIRSEMVSINLFVG